MKECPVRFMVIGNCSDRPDGECIVLDNEGIDKGRVTAMAEAFNGFSSEVLLELAVATGRGGGYNKRCKASLEIYVP